MRHTCSRGAQIEPCEACELSYNFENGLDENGDPMSPDEIERLRQQMEPDDPFDPFLEDDR